jgi:hypothetical protein
MTSLLRRLENTRNGTSHAKTTPTPGPPAQVSDVEESPIQEPKQPENEIMSYLLNPPLPKNEDIETEPEAIDVVGSAVADEPLAEQDAADFETETLMVRSIPATHNGHHPVPVKRNAGPEGCLAWLDFLCKNVHPAALHLLLGYYRRIGWLPASSHAMLRDLCDGIARQNRNMSWDSLRLAPEQLIQVHAESYRWLSAMFPASAKATATVQAGTARAKKASARRQ